MNKDLLLHPFLADKGLWEGEGIITFSMADDELSFSSVWKVTRQDEGIIQIIQEVDVKESPEKMCNHFSLNNIESGSFAIDLENALIGKVHGKGVIDEHRIAWEFRNTGIDFEGFEIYEKISEDTYSMQAQFSAGEGLRTYIKGKLTKK